MEVYPAGEEPIPGADSRSLARSIRQRSTLDPILAADAEQVATVLQRVLQPNDLLLTMGAGSIGRFAQALAAGDVVGGDS